VLKLCDLRSLVLWVAAAGVCSNRHRLGESGGWMCALICAIVLGKLKWRRFLDSSSMCAGR
jgi:hypothetical protein